MTNISNHHTEIPQSSRIINYGIPLFCFLETGFCYVAQDSLELIVILSTRITAIATLTNSDSFF